MVCLRRLGEEHGIEYQDCVHLNLNFDDSQSARISIPLLLLLDRIRCSTYISSNVVVKATNLVIR